MPSSTWMPRTPLTRGEPSFSGVTKMKRQPSRGHVTKPTFYKVSLKALNHKQGASMRPYAPPIKAHCSLPLIPSLSLNSGGACIPKARPSPCPLRKAVDMSKLTSFHLRLTTAVCHPLTKLERHSVLTANQHPQNPKQPTLPLLFSQWIQVLDFSKLEPNGIARLVLG